MKGFTIKNGEIRRTIGPNEEIYLKTDVKALIEEWIAYFTKGLENTDDSNVIQRAKYDGALWSLGVIKNQFE
jgi:hypothetical protein